MTTKAEVLSAIRAKCLDCVCGSWKEVELCHITGCELHPFRFGKDPAPAKGGRRPAFQKEASRDDDLISKTSQGISE